MGERSTLTAAQKRRYARQVLLGEIGERGQLRLCATHVRLPVTADPRAAAVAIDYLERAGMSFTQRQDAAVLELSDAAAVRMLSSGQPLLEDAAAALVGAFAAVEAIKATLGIGARAGLAGELTLGPNVTS